MIIKSDNITPQSSRYKKSNIIFDFDGTIADSYKYVYKSIRTISQKYFKRKITSSQLKELRNLNTREIFRKIGFPLLKLPFYLKRIQNDLFKDIDKIKPIKNMDYVIRELHKSNYNLSIVTTNIKENVVRFLDNYSLNYFKVIIAGSSLLGKHKILRKMIKDYKYEPENTVYIGDETRDIEASRKNKIKIIAVTWGFNGAKILKEYKPDFLAKSPEEILKYLKDINYSK